MLASLYMFQPFDLHHGSRPHYLWESYQHNKQAFRENDCTIGETQWGQSPVENTWLWSLLTTEGSSFLSQPPLKYLSPQLIAPLINYTPATGLQLIIYMLLISISPIDFCHSFEMYILEGVFSLPYSWHLANDQEESTRPDKSGLQSNPLKKLGTCHQFLGFDFSFFHV